MAIRTVEELQALFASHGVRTLHVKRLAPKQDNEKNQIYLGRDVAGILNLFPATLETRSASESRAKRKSAPGEQKVEALIRLSWLHDNGSLSRVPGARIIDYFQYPEARLSGFLKGCKAAPDALRRDQQAQYGRRILVLGANPDGTVLGKVLTELEDPVVANFPDLPVLPSVPIFQVLSVLAPAGIAPFDLLVGELRAIASAGWHQSVILKPGAAAPVAFRGNQGAGYTLEALLGVPANADKKPDKHGYEVKSFRGDKVSLMTPAPDGGFQGDHSFREFMARHGKDGKKGDGSRRFTGVHRVGRAATSTGFEMRITGHDPVTDQFDVEAGVAVEIYDPVTGDIVASWSFEHLGNSWNAKHASAVYVPAEARETGLGTHQYRFANEVLVGEGTDIFRLLRAIQAGLVFYDPADSIYADGRAKVRPQWRVSAGRLEQTMGQLYGRVTRIRL